MADSQAMDTVATVFNILLVRHIDAEAHLMWLSKTTQFLFSLQKSHLK